MKVKYLTMFCIAAIVASASSPAVADDQPDTSATTVQTTDVALSVTTQRQRLSDVRKIFISSLGNGEGAELIRQKLINDFAQSGILRVVDSVAEADATLTGAGLLGNSLVLRDGTGGTSFNTSLVVRLIGKARQTLWTNSTENGRLLHRRSTRSTDRAVSYVADETVKALIKQMRQEQDTAQIGSAHSSQNN